MNYGDDEQIKKYLRVIAEKDEIMRKRHKDLLDYENKLLKQRRTDIILTRQANMSGLGGAAFNLLQNIGQAKMSNYQRLRDLNEKSKTEILSPEEGKEKTMLESSKSLNKIFGKLDRTFEKLFGGDSKWNKFFGGHGKAAALGLGVGAIGGGMALGKMIIDSSPMFQQMLKLLNFGIMLVLRPIGDFFGFLMRPIMLMLLRKFIIPFYQEYMPLMIEMGDKIGNVIAPVLGKLLHFIIGMSKILFALTPLGATALTATGGVGEVAKWVKEGAEEIASVFKDSIKTNETKPTYIDASKQTKKQLDEDSKKQGKTKNTAKPKYGKYGSDDWKRNASPELLALDAAPRFQSASDMIGLVSKSINDFINTNYASGKLKNEGLRKAGKITTQLYADIYSGKYENATQAFKRFKFLMDEKGLNKMAGGGIINEPIVGVGRSGQGYMFGESGAEKVTPLTGGFTGGSITINIYGDVDNKTMDMFEKKVLSVLNKSNSRRIS